MASTMTEALEVEKVSSHLHPEGSFDVADHEVPTGREEIWRFTPLKRLRGLHDDAALDGDGVGAEADAPEGVTVELIEPDSPLRGSSGFVPGDRIAARVWAAATRIWAVTIPEEAAPEAPVLVTLTGKDTDAATAGHVVISAGRPNRG